MRLKTFLLSLLLVPLLDACFPPALMLAEGGIGGTGISTGVITAFGSVFVNGVEYNTDEATLIRDGKPAYDAWTDYNIGEYVTVKGKVNPDGVTGTASEVVFNNILEGEVTRASSDGVSLEIMGQTVRANALTVFHGFNLLSSLAVANVVEVSGVRGVNGDIIASSLTLKTSFSGAEIYGTALHVDVVNKTLNIGNLIVDYSSAALSGDIPSDGQYLEVKSLQHLQDLSSGGKLMIASEVALKEQYQHFSEGAEIEIEGMITYVASATNFTVNGQSITTNAQTRFEDCTASDLLADVLVEVDGAVNAQGILVADEVSVKQSANQPITEREGLITAIDGVAKEFVLSGNTVTVNAATIWEDKSTSAIVNMNFSYLYVGNTLEVKTKTLSNGKLLALRVKRKNG